MIEKRIITEIESLMLANHSIWTVGVTDNPAELKQEHKNPRHWRQLDAGTEEVAKKIEQHFLDKGCKNGSGGGENANYVYIF